MSTAIKIIFWIIILILVVLGVRWYFSSRLSQPGTKNIVQQNPATQTGTSPQNTANNLQLTPPSDTSNAAIDNDLAYIDNQINGLNTYATNIDGILSQVAGPIAPAPETDSISTIISVADNGINQKINGLSDLLGRVSSAERISADGKVAFTSTIQNEIDQLTALKAAIDGETNKPAAVADYKSIAGSYGIYNLIFPQISMVIASAQVLAAESSMNKLNTKINSRIPTGGAQNATALKQIFSDFNTKLADADSKSRSAALSVIPLKPANGDMAKTSSDIKIINAANQNIKISLVDLAAVRKDIGTIVNYVKESTNN